MQTQFDEKGKIFTQVVHKTPVSVLIQTTRQLIRGKVHIRPDTRIKDELDQNENFLALTEVEILDDQGEILRNSPFLAVSRGQIVWVMPLETTEDGENDQ